jgi:hypothetical protein
MRIAEEGGKAGRGADVFQALRDAEIEIGFHRLRRQIHREIDIDRRRKISRRARRRLGNEGALAHLRIEQSAAARFAIGARHRGEIDAERIRQRPMGGKPLAAHEATAGNVGGQRIDDALEHRALPFPECREPIHAI